MKPNSRLVPFLVTLVLCLTGGGLALRLQGQHFGGASWRPEAGLLLGLLLVIPRETWRWTVCGGWLASLALVYASNRDAGGAQFAFSCGIASLQVLGTLLAAAWMRQWSGPDLRFERVRDVHGLILFPCTIAAAGVAVVEAMLRSAPGWTALAAAVTHHWTRDWLGYLVWAPPVVFWVNRVRSGPRPDARVVFHAGAVAVVTAVSAAIAFHPASTVPVGSMAFVYLPFPALVWAAMRFGPAGASGASLVFSSIVLWQLSSMRSVLSAPEEVREASVRWVQLYLLVGSGMSLLLAVVVAERRRGAEALEATTLRLRRSAEELQAAERSARRTEHLYRQAIHAARAVPYFRDYRSETFSFMGEGIHSLTGYPAEEMTPQVWDGMVREHVMRGWAEGLHYRDAVVRARAGEQMEWTCDALIQRRDGTERWICDTSVEVLDEQTGKPSGSIGILMDITDRKQSEAAMQSENAGLEGRMIERTQELEAAVRELEAFTYSISHDLRSPLRAIEGFSRIIQEDHLHELGDEVGSMFKRLRSAALRMDALVRDLLLFSRLGRQTMGRQPLDLNRLVQEAIVGFQLSSEGREVRIQHDELPMCMGDPDLMREVIHHLISNALKFTRNTEGAWIHIGVTQEDGETVYFVRDNGVGFDMAYAERLFGLFQRLHRADEFEGSGVGLAIAQRILRRHGGRIRAEARPGKGATFYFTVGQAPAMSLQPG